MIGRSDWKQGKEDLILEVHICTNKISDNGTRELNFMPEYRGVCNIYNISLFLNMNISVLADNLQIWNCLQVETFQLFNDSNLVKNEETHSSALFII